MAYTQLMIPNGRPSLMSRLVRSLWREPVLTNDPEFARKMGLGRPSATGLSVNEDTALAYSAVWAAVSVIAGDIASLPLLLYRRKDDTRERYTSHPLYTLVHDQPNPEMTSVVFRELLQAHALLWGNGFAEIERDGSRRPIALWPVTPDRVTPRRSGGRIEYLVKNDRNQDVIIPREDMLHIPGLGFDGVQGYSVVSKARESIGLGLAAERFGASFYGNGSTFGGVLSTDKQLSPKALENLRAALEARHQGVDRAHKLTLLEEGLKYSQIGVTPEDGQFLESRQFQVTEIARWFGVPPHKIGDLSRATFSNIDAQELDYFKTSLQRWIRKWEQELTSKLVFPLERTQQFIEFQVDGFLRGDSAGRASLEAAHFQMGAATPNDIRSIENRNPLKGGDRGFVPMNMIPMDRVDEWFDAEIEAKKRPAPVPQKPTQDESQAQRAIQELQEYIAREAARSESEKLRGIIETLKAERDEAVDEAHASEARLVTANQEYQSYMETVAGKLKALSHERDAAQLDRASALESLRIAQAGETVAKNLRKESEFAAIEAEDRARKAEESRDLHKSLELKARDEVVEMSKAYRKAESARLLGVAMAHRALFVDVMRRLVEREVERAQRQQQTQEKLSAWVDSFYVTFELAAAEALLPAVRVHLAWKQSADDPETVTRALVKAHVLESTRQLDSVVDMESHEWQAELAKMLTRWAERRPDAFADGLVAEEMEYVRSLQS